MFLSAFRVLDGYFRLFNRYLCAMLLVSVAGANAAGAPAAAVPLLPAELSTLVTAAIRNHPAARSAQAKRRAALQDVAAMNPCPCGYLGHPSIACTDTRTQVARYQGKISGPLLDRIDLHVSVLSVPYQSLFQSAPGETTAVVRERVLQAHGRAIQRQQQQNARLTGESLTTHAILDAAGHQFLQAVAARFHWSARRLHRVLRVARTIADLANVDAITSAHLSEAVQYQRVLQA